MEETDLVREKAMEISLLTDIGQKRSNNQDYVNKYDNKAGITLIILADGMGGHRAGNIASEMTVTDLGREWVGTDMTEASDIQEWFKTQIELENQHVFEMGQNEDYQGMGTTIEAVAIVGDEMVFAHVGDSRINVVRGSNYRQLTSDHSLVNELLKAGEITQREADNHPQRNVITQSIGQATPLSIDLGRHVLADGEIFLINSDGLTNMISREKIISILSSKSSLNDKAKKLIDAANAAGGSDNITVALVQHDEEIKE